MRELLGVLRLWHCEVQVIVVIIHIIVNRFPLALHVHIIGMEMTELN